MKKLLYFNCDMGAAGDMLTAALLDAVSDREKLMEQLNLLGIPGIVYELREGEIVGREMNIRIH